MKKNFVLAACFFMLLGTAAMATPMHEIYRDYDDFMASVAQSDWSFTRAYNQTGGSGFTQWLFEMENASLDSDIPGRIYASVFNGNGANGPMFARANADGTLSLAHNSANKLDLIFQVQFEPENYIDSLYFNITPWSSWSADLYFTVHAEYVFEGVIHTSDEVITDVNNNFWGISLQEGAYLTMINFSGALISNPNGTPNNGYRMTMGFGGDFCDENDTSSWCYKGGGDCDDFWPGTPEWYEAGCGNEEVPEPGTIFLLGTGIIGLGIVARRKMAKK